MPCELIRVDDENRSRSNTFGWCEYFFLSNA